MKRKKSVNPNFKNSKQTNIILGVFALVLISAIFVYASVVELGKGIMAVRNIPEKIDFNGDCVTVTNKHSSYDVFIPKSSLNEWETFKRNKPEYIELTGCVQGTLNCKDISSDSIGLDYTYSDVISNKVSIFKGSTKIMTFSIACSDPVSDGTTNFCRFSQGTCPSGWRSYQSWSTATSNFCEGGCKSCTARGHSWSNSILDTCAYQKQFIWCLSEQTCTAIKTQIGCIPTGSGSSTASGLSSDTTYTFYLRDGDTSTSPLLAQVSCTTDSINPVEQDCWDLLYECGSKCPDCALIEDPIEWDMCWNEATSCHSSCQEDYPCTSDGGCTGCPVEELAAGFCTC